MKNEYLRVFQAFTDENRIRILELLCNGEECACVLLENLKISQPTLSYHMKILCKSGIVKKRRVGPWNYYAIDSDGCDYASRLLNIIVQKKLSDILKVAGKFHYFLRIVKRKKEKKKDCEISKTCCNMEISDNSGGNWEKNKEFISF